ncbi:hypothetical protein I7I51_08532 [Histoplasma capsulatum]|uniref:Uncharacterized protein n=1 Tax=Ajellomyces capsulatus TaxID=5037 RepID=A0A8A1M114_AJECA|nr:hypothetical protein I7I51_08532 [Histoplasma capsulatum]
MLYAIGYKICSCKEVQAEYDKHHNYGNSYTDDCLGCIARTRCDGCSPYMDYQPNMLQNSLYFETLKVLRHHMRSSHNFSLSREHHCVEHLHQKTAALVEEAESAANLTRIISQRINLKHSGAASGADLLVCSQ